METGPGYDNLTIYFMSGTGNSYRLCCRMADAAKARGVASKVLTIDRRPPSSMPTYGLGSLVGLVMPTHGFTAPWHMIRFAAKMTRGRGAHAFAAASRGMTKVGRVHIPGMEGTAAYLIALILRLKGYRVRGVIGLDAPANWLAVHPPFGTRSMESILSKGGARAERFAGVLLDGRRYFGFGGFVCLFLGLALLPISLMYLLRGRFFLAKLFFADDRCNGCGICAANCPVRAILMMPRRKPRPFWSYRCESCMRCMAFCPLNAVQAGHSWAAALVYVTNIPVYLYALQWISRATGKPWVSDIVWVRNLTEYPYFLMATAVAYLGFSLLVRVPAINALFAYTTLTRIYPRRHEPATRLADIAPVSTLEVSD